MAGHNQHRLADQAAPLLLHDRAGDGIGFSGADGVGDVGRARGDDAPDHPFLVGVAPWKMGCPGEGPGTVSCSGAPLGSGMQLNELEDDVVGRRPNRPIACERGRHRRAAHRLTAERELRVIGEGVPISEHRDCPAGAVLAKSCRGIRAGLAASLFGGSLIDRVHPAHEGNRAEICCCREQRSHPFGQFDESPIRDGTIVVRQRLSIRTGQIGGIGSLSEIVGGANGWQ